MPPIRRRPHLPVSLLATAVALTAVLLPGGPGARAEEGAETGLSADGPQLIIVPDPLGTGPSLRARAADPAAAPVQRTVGSQGWIDTYVAFAERKLEHALELDLYGTTAQLPAGVFSMKYQFRYLGADERFDGFGKRTSLIPEINFTDDLGTELVSIDLRGTGEGVVHLFQFSVGLTDPLDMFMEITWADVRTELDPVASFGGPLAALGLQDYEDLKQVLQLLGRPPPNELFETDGLEFGDIQLGFSWNYFRNPEWSLSMVGSFFIPTGEVADANNDINFALGPELDRGAGGYQVLWVNNLDHRPAWADHKLTLSFELDYTYGLPYDRDTPSSFTEPNALVSGLLDLVGFDSELFPDLTDIPDDFEWAPGQAIDVLAIVAYEPIRYLGLAVQYGFNYSEAVEINSESEAFIGLIEALELTGESYTHAVSVTVAPNMIEIGQALFGVPLPFLQAFIWEVPVAGKNAIIFDPAFRSVTQVVLPLW